jgi:hypothetical protein
MKKKTQGESVFKINKKARLTLTFLNPKKIAGCSLERVESP